MLSVMTLLNIKKKVGKSKTDYFFLVSSIFLERSINLMFINLMQGEMVVFMWPCSVDI